MIHHRSKRIQGVLILFLAGLVIIPGLWASNVGSGNLSFNKHIRPILASNCYSCHGPDESSLKADLRLDLFEEATREIDGFKAIAPGNPQASIIMERIRSKDPDEVMPPPETGHAITPEQADILEKWIEQGANYERHWSFNPLSKPDYPTVQNTAWPINGIDYFTLDGIENAGFEPSLQADPYTLVRRLYLDLTGLPPTWKEAQEFANNEDPEAYEKLVDKLLDNPAYGEKWASMWLDLARYADSAGYGSDPLRTIWKYRDWVIDAWNKNLSYEQFTYEQIAGDLFENPTKDQLLATAFHRNTKTNTEGGTDDEEFRTEAVRDRVDTTVQVWMGLTMGCAKCHTHKYDPISIKEYYEFYDFFNQTADSDRGDEFPKLSTPTRQQELKIAELQSEIDRLNPATTTINGDLKKEYEEWKTKLQEPQPNNSLVLSSWMSIGPFKAKSFDEAHSKEFVKFSSIDFEKDVESGDQKLRWAEKPEWKDGVITSLEGDNSATYLYRTITVENATHRYVSLGSDDSIQVFLNGKKILDNKVSRGVAKDQEILGLELNKGENKLLIKVANGSGGYGFYFNLKDKNAPDEIIALVGKEEKGLSDEEKKKIEKHFLDTSSTVRVLKKQLADASNKKRDIENRVIKTPIMQERSADKKRLTHVLVKGSFLNQGEKVAASVPSAFHNLPEGAPKNRLGVAKWLMDKQNPLTARVSVNRFWARIFGKGLVETEEDFGSQGKMPSHPELLDWLASTFQNDLEWDMKKLVKLIVTSATYRQSSIVQSEKLEKDPNNILLARMSRIRLDAELVRDQSLSVSGLLSQKLRGPSVFPPQPDGLWRAAFNGQRNWATSENEDRYRRGLYTFLRRSIPYPSMATFDAPSRETCTIRRIPTNTPLQAFVTMNDPAFVEMSQGFALRIAEKKFKVINEALTFALQTALVRPASPEQIKVLEELYLSEVEHYKNHPDQAKEMLGRFKEHFSDDIPIEESAAWVVVANVILNLDGFLMKG